MNHMALPGHNELTYVPMMPYGLRDIGHNYALAL